jgi:hypothetical protein
VLDREVLEDPGRFERLLGITPAWQQSFATHIAQTWLNAIADGEQVFMVCFDEIVTRPAHCPARSAVVSSAFIRSSPARSRSISVATKGVQKPAMPDAIRRVLVQHFAEELYASGEDVRWRREVLADPLRPELDPRHAALQPRKHRSRRVLPPQRCEGRLGAVLKSSGEKTHDR